MSVSTVGKSVDLERILSGAQLPALPQSAIKVLELSRNPDNGPPEFAVAIEADPGLTGQVLRFVNSSYFGFSQEISSIKHAVSLVGIRTIKNFALWSAVFSLMPNPKCGPFDLKNLWCDSVRRGLFARAMVRIQGVREAEDAFAAALLQDMAVPLLAKHLPVEYTRLLEDRTASQRRLSELEQDRFGWNHAQAAARMARGWKLPVEFAELIEGHVSLAPLTSSTKPNPFAAAVSLSSLLPSSTEETWADGPAFEQFFAKLRPATGPTMAEAIAQVDTEFEEFAPLLKLPHTTRPLVEYVTLIDNASAESGAEVAEPVA